MKGDDEERTENASFNLIGDAIAHKIYIVLQQIESRSRSRSHHTTERNEMQR